MYKIIVIFIAIQGMPLYGVWYNPFSWGSANKLSLPVVPVPIDPTLYAGGVATSNTVAVVKEIRGVLKDVLDNSEALGKAAHSTSHGFTRGLLTGPASAVKDGATYVKDTAVEHPYIAAATIGTVGLAGAYYKFRPLSEEEQEQAKIKKAQRLAQIRAAAMVETADATADEFRTCLNIHARASGTCEDKFRRCHSPARRLALLNRKKADEIASAFRAYQ